MWQLAAGLLAVGGIAGGALSALVLILATGRARASRLVAERTGELRGAQAQLVDTARAQEIGGTLTAQGNGAGTGATFTLQLPLRALEAAA